MRKSAKIEPTNEIKWKTGKTHASPKCVLLQRDIERVFIEDNGKARFAFYGKMFVVKYYCVESERCYQV